MLFKVSLGILTSVAGFLEVGSIGTSLQAGAAFQYALLWPIALGGICIAFLTEMSGRLAAVSRHALADAVRERFGFHYQSVALAAQVLVDLLVLTAEVGGVALAMQLATGISLRVWVLPIGFLVWLLLWRGSFQIIEHGVAVLGLVTLSFVFGAAKLHPDWHRVAAGLVPRLPDHDIASYAFIAVSILGATISPYLVSFYSSGAVEEKWREKDIPINRVVAGLGMGTGCLISMAVLVVAAQVLAPRGILVQEYHQTGSVLTAAFPHWGFRLFVASLGIGCFGAALELALDSSYIVAQAFGWNWGEDQPPADDARFCLVYTAVIALASVFMLTGIEPLKLTLVSMVLTVLVLPLPIAPLLVLMNDRRVLRDHTNGVVTNVAVVAILAIAVVLALVAIPLKLFGGA
jgi:Mn2+/Fe2+ NRAMP family transporter